MPNVRTPILILRRRSFIHYYLFLNLITISAFFITPIQTSKNDNVAYTSLEKEVVPSNSNLTNSIAESPTSEEPPAIIRSHVRCDASRIKCALRQGCGAALMSYMLDCADLMAGRVDECDPFCEASLIALTSTDEGEELMDCVCNDDFCLKTQKRMEVCREKVILAKGKDAVVSCSVAHLICTADTQCSTAISYYDRLCKRMFQGRECSFRCNNSISILSRQDNAAKLETCICDGTESFDCFGIKINMKNLCFNYKAEEEKNPEDEDNINQIDVDNQDSIGKKPNVNSSGGTIHQARGGIPFFRRINSKSLIMLILGFLIVGLDVRWRGSVI